MRLLAYYEAQECLMLAEAHNRGKKRHQHTQRNTYEIWKSFDKLQRTYALIGLGLLVTVRGFFHLSLLYLSVWNEPVQRRTLYPSRPCLCTELGC